MDTYILKGDEVVGPLTRSEVLQGIADGSFSIEDFCAREGWSEWKKVGDLYKERPVNPNPPQSVQSDKKKGARRSKNWRDDPVTERQKDLIRSKGKRIPKTKGEASDLISSLLGTGPSPRQIAKLKFLNISWATADDAYALLDAVENDPSYAERIAAWDKEKSTLYPELYAADGSYKNEIWHSKNRRLNEKSKKKKLGCFSYFIIAIVVFSVVSKCGIQSDGDLKKGATSDSSPTPRPRTSQSPVIAPLSETEMPKTVTVSTPNPFPESKWWPDKVHILKPLTFNGVVAGGSIQSTIPAGTLLSAKLSNDHRNVVVHYLDLSKAVPIEETDFLDLARKSAQGRQ